ncbi:hypothetical protein ATCC90586_001583 [Pythium insidiosum]|nr:hypothetical protein ATCC90586_001583 [Pythium insidiosum]
MKVLGLAASLLLVTVATSNADKSSQEGQWAPCGYSTPAVQVTNETAPFECLNQKVPLCYDGICESDKEIDFFVRRRLAANETTDGAKRAVILIQGGPGAGSYAMEPIMASLQEKLDGTVDFYTFDHRGTGLSEFIKCDGLRTNSEEGIGLTLNELAGCLDEINTKYDGQAAGFSVTSAARDVQHIINKYLSEHHVFLYGQSYGTYLTQRLMQLEIPQVKGYIFDGVDARSDEGDEIETANSHWNQAIHAPSKRLLEYCAADASCPLKFKSAETAYEEVMDLYKRMDVEVEKNECLRKVLTNEKTGEVFNSTTVRNGLAGLMRSSSQRAVGLSTLAEVQACLLTRGMSHRKDHGQHHPVSIGLGEFPEPVTNMSELLYSAVVFSERWAQPAPTMQERLKFFLDGPFSMYSEVEALRYCVFTGSDEAACKEMEDVLPTNKTQTFFYKRDEFFTKPLRLPAGASALIINGGLDFQTPTEFGELLYNKLSSSGEGTLMVTFDYGNHCAGEAVADGEPTPCRDSIVSQFVLNDGDIGGVSLECMNSLPALSFEISVAPEGETPADKEAHKNHSKKHGKHRKSKKESHARHA